MEHLIYEPFFIIPSDGMIVKAYFEFPRKKKKFLWNNGENPEKRSAKNFKRDFEKVLDMKKRRCYNAANFKANKGYDEDGWSSALSESRRMV